jgi:5-methylcytosine-specific restriction protein A
MPSTSLRPCAQPRCPTLTTTGRCPAHQKERQRQADQRRGTAQARGYDYRWALFSAAWRKRFPVCGMRADGQVHVEHSACAQQGRLTTVDLVTDHITPLAQGGAKFDEANLQTLCLACNTRKDTGWGKRRSA